MTAKKKQKKPHLRIIPLGGLGEVGRNMTLFEFEGSILIVDVGLRFPEEDTPGIDYIIPNTNYLHNRKEDIVGIVFTHGHYDHIGALPYLIKEIYRPDLKIFASPLTKGIILKRQQDFPGQPKIDIKEVKHGSKVKLPPFVIECFQENHNIPDTLGLFIQTPVGNIVHTADFKFDKKPVNALPTDFKTLKSIGDKKILLLLSDSTGAEEEGHSLSEHKIAENLEKIFEKAKGRIIVATFSSLINRIQQIISLSEKYKRKVAIEGYSMNTNVKLAERLGYIKAKKGTLIRTQNVKDYPDSKITVLCTGAQGEEEAALMRIITNEHRLIKLHKNDTVVFSSSIIPGNERTVQYMKDEILLQGADIYHYEMMDIHAGGHGKREELKKMIEIMNPKFLMPIHGQHSMLFSHAKLAQEAGIPENNVIVAENGQVIQATPRKVAITKEEVPANHVMVDGLGVGDIGEIVLRDRKRLADDGIFVIIAVVDKKTGKVRGSPDIISRGFVYLRESKELLRDARKKVIKIVNDATGSGGAVNWRYVKKEIQNKLGQFLFSKTERRPMVLPVLIEV
ncbi:MAG: RNase J family beta-CASP ribonuclease [Candidatus Nealsonbacteria bacterium]|nr:RNase J family beta-CASP ribonuclease [Candidatus Nealsonbacteria bacterium]